MWIFRNRAAIYTLIAMGLAFSTIILLLLIMPQDNNDYGKAFFDKENHLEEYSTKKKMIFIGGSGMAFGLDCSIIQMSFPEFHVINMGLHAAVGLNFMLEQVKPYIGTGDVVVVSPEYEQFDNMLYGNSSGLILNIILSDPKYILRLKQPHLSIILQSVPLELQRRNNKLFRQFLAKKDRDEPAKHKIYHRHAFNEYGDVVSHKAVNTSLLAKDQYSTSKYTLSEFRYLNRGVQDISEFNAYCRSRHAKVLFLFPQLIDSVYFNSIQELDKFKVLLENNGIDRLNTPSQSVMPLTDFMDTPHHLLFRAAQKRSVLVSSYLKVKLENENWN